MSPAEQAYLELGYWLGVMASVAGYLLSVGVRRVLDAWHNSYMRRKEDEHRSK